MVLQLGTDAFHITKNGAKDTRYGDDYVKQAFCDNGKNSPSSFLLNWVKILGG